MPREATHHLPPNWVLVAGSAALLFHLFNAVMTTLHVHSGPWPSPVGSSPAEPPPFTNFLGNEVTTPYNRVLKVNHAFHFLSTRQEIQEISFEVLLKDANGKVVARRTIPDPEANAFVRQRQWLLAQQLGGDEPMPPQMGVVLPPAGQSLPTLHWWEPAGERQLRLRKGTANDVPRGQPVLQPSEASFVAVRSYARYLCRLHGAEKAEVIRIWRDPIMPTVLFAPEPPGREILQAYQSSYGELTP